MDGTQTCKRPRPVVSCPRCREKKLKCDRIMPCEKCIKSGCPSECMYNQSPASLDALPKAKHVQLGSEAVDQHPDHRVEPGGNAGIGIIEDLQLGLGKLEEFLSVTSPANLGFLRDVSIRGSSSPQSSDITQPASSLPFLGILVVKGTRTRYRGQNNRITPLNQFSEAREFIDQCAKDPTVAGLAKEVQFLQSQSKLSPNSPESISDLESCPELQQLRAYLAEPTLRIWYVEVLNAFDLLANLPQLQSIQLIFPSTDPQFTPTSQPQLPDFLVESSALATEFNNFQGDPFTFEDGSFAWDI